MVKTTTSQAQKVVDSINNKTKDAKVVNKK